MKFPPGPSELATLTVLAEAELPLILPLIVFETVSPFTVRVLPLNCKLLLVVVVFDALLYGILFAPPTTFVAVVAVSELPLN